jgi:hypothetical protein
MASNVAVGDHGGSEGTLLCSLTHLRKSGIIQDHLRSATTVLSAPIKRQARLIKVDNICQLLLMDSDLVRDWVMIREPKLNQVLLPIAEPQQ